MRDVVRVSVASSDATVDVVVPGHLAVAALLPDLAPTGAGPVVLRTVAGRELDPGQGLAAQGIRDGDLLVLTPPVAAAPVHDDPAEAVAERVSASVLGADQRVLRPMALVSAGLLLALAGVALGAGPGWAGSMAAGASVVLGLVAVTIGVRRHDRLLVVFAGWAAVAHAAVAGWQLAGGSAAAGCASASALVLVRTTGRFGVVFVPAAVAAASLGALAVVVETTRLAPGPGAALALVLLLLLEPALAGTSLGLARGQVAAARELHRAALLAVGVMSTALSVVAAESAAGAALVTIAAVTTGCRATRPHGVVEIVIRLATALAGLLVAGGAIVARHPPLTASWGLLALALGLVAVAVAAWRPAVPEGRGGGATVPGLFLGVDRLESLLLVALVPVLALVSGALPIVRGLVDR